MSDQQPAGLRCDLHLHSRASGEVSLPVLGSVGQECYTEPLAAYGEARRRGMDLVTLTDHDSVAGALAIAGLPGTFVSEEVTVGLPGGRFVHIGAYDITEAQHERIARLRSDAETLFAFLAENRIPAALNHPFSALTGRREPEDLRRSLARLPLVETRNGMMPERHNRYAAAVGRAAGLAGVGGSDAHTLDQVARAWTEVPGARSREEFLSGLRAGLTIPCGTSGSYARFVADLAALVTRGLGEVAAAVVSRPIGLLVLPFAVLLTPTLPLIAAGLRLREALFAERCLARLRERPEPRVAARAGVALEAQR